jgi:methionine biosynthesis protein MetW
MSLSVNKKIIADFVPLGAKILDIGCGDGRLMAWLATEKNVTGQGIELDNGYVQKAIARGLSVVQGDAEADISFYRDKIYDVVIMNQSLQMMKDPKKMLREAARVGKQVVVSVPNFGYWYNRFYLGVYGKMPVSKQLDYMWYETPNIHFCTLKDFVCLCRELSIRVEKSDVLIPFATPKFLAHQGWFSNIFAQKGVFLLSDI